jgi:predicted permease
MSTNSIESQHAANPSGSFRSCNSELQVYTPLAITIKAIASYLPVIGPIIGFCNRVEIREKDRQDEFYCQDACFRYQDTKNAAGGSVLTIVVAIALAAIGSYAIAAALLVLGVGSLIHNVRTYRFYSNVLKENSKPQENDLINYQLRGSEEDHAKRAEFLAEHAKSFKALAERSPFQGPDLKNR